MKTILVTGSTGWASADRDAQRAWLQGAWLSRDRDLTEEPPVIAGITGTDVDSEALEQADDYPPGWSESGEGRWSEARVEIVASRVDTAGLLFDSLKERTRSSRLSRLCHRLLWFSISDKVFTEDQPGEQDFLSDTCRQWEEAAFRFNTLPGVRTVALRTGFVVDGGSDAFRKMLLPTRLGVGAPLGSGRQYLSWIHLEDLCRLYIRAVEDSAMEGIYNAVAPEQITNAQFMRTLAKEMHRPFFVPAVPAMMLRLVMGEAAILVLGGSSISAQKILESGFRFRYGHSSEAIRASL